MYKLPKAFNLTAAVEGCLNHGLKRRSLGLFKTHSTTALVYKLAKNFEPAEVVARMLERLDSIDTNKYVIF